MFHLIRLIIWLAGIVAIAYFALPYFGYELNVNYWNERKSACQEKLTQCQNDLIRSGINGAKETCQWDCVDPKLFVRKK